VGLERGENPLIPRSPEEFFAMLDFVTVEKPFLPRWIGAYLAAEQVARRSELLELFDGWVAQDANDLDSALERVQAPTLVIQGARDRVIHPSSARAIAERVTKAKLMLLPDIGHVPQLEAPKLVARAITEFLS
jgi:pimeloyl-ACP methyl ester carboxylesterase